MIRIPVNLTSRIEVAELCAIVDSGRYGFVGFDTLARCMVGADENSARDCGIVINNLNLIREATPAGRGVALGVHHAGKDGKTFRGSSAFEGGADTVYLATRDGAVVTLERTKRKDGPELDHHELRFDPIKGTVSGAISVHRGVDKSERGDRLLSTFVQHFSTTGASKADLRRVADMPEGTFYRALNDLLECGDLINDGTTKRPFYRLAQE